MIPAELPSGPELGREADRESLLDGEDPQSRHIDDAVRWVRVYGELLRVKMSLVDPSGQIREGASDDPVREPHLDQGVLRAEAERYRRRLAYWTNRTKVLAAEADRDGN